MSKYEQRYGAQQKNNLSSSSNNNAAIPTRAQVAIDLFRPHLQRDVLFGAQLIQDGVRIMYPGARLFPFTPNPFHSSCGPSSSSSFMAAAGIPVAVVTTSSSSISSASASAMLHR